LRNLERKFLRDTETKLAGNIHKLICNENYMVCTLVEQRFYSYMVTLRRTDVDTVKVLCISLKSAYIDNK